MNFHENVHELVHDFHKGSSLLFRELPFVVHGSFMKQFMNDSCFFRRGGLHQAHLAQLVACLGLNFDVHRFDFRDRQIPSLVVGYW